MIFIEVISSFLIVYVGSYLFTTSGLFLIDDSFKKFNFPPLLPLVLGYFSGLTFFIFVWRVLELLLGSAKVSFFAAFCISLFFSFLFLKERRTLGFRNYWQLFSLGSLALLVQAFSTTFWSRENVEHAFSTVGSGHSPRFANISLFMVDSDKIPILGMNYVQSLLSGFPAYFGQRFPLLYLALWLGLALFVVSLMTYYLLKWLGLNRTTATIGSVFVLFGNTALSLSHYLVLDTVSPFLLAGYSDSLHSLGTLILFGLIASNLWTQSQRFLSLKSVVLIFSVLYSSTLMAPQNIFVILLLIGLLVLGALFFKPVNLVRIKNFLLVTLILIFSLLAGTRFGGFLTPSKLHETALIPGVQHLPDEKIDIRFDPYIPYHLGNFRGWGSIAPEKPLVIENDTPLLVLEKFIDRILNSLKVLFFPLFGFLILLCFGRKDSPLQKLSFLTFLSILCGFILVWPFGICDSKWPQARFLIPGVYLGQLCFVAALNRINFRVPEMPKTILFAGVTIFACWGPMTNTYPIIYDNVTDRIGFKTRLAWLLSYQSPPTVDIMKDTWICRK